MPKTPESFEKTPHHYNEASGLRLWSTSCV